MSYNVQHCQADQGATFVICDEASNDIVMRTFSNTPEDRVLADRVVALLNSTATTGFTIVVDSGNVTAVVTHDPAFVGTPYWTVDFDTEGADASRFTDGMIRSVAVDGAKPQLAYVFQHKVELAGIMDHPSAAPVVTDFEED